MKRKRIPRSFRKNNIHGGKLWANRNECKMSDHIAGEIIDRVYESGKVTIAQLKQVRHTLSYSYYLMTGESEANWPEVAAQWESFDFNTLPRSVKSLKAVRIPTPANLKTAFTSPWTPQHRWSLTKFITGGLAAYDYFVFGLRPRVDMGKVKNSVSHFLNVNERYGYTRMKGGRSKLQGNKKGTRQWFVYRPCLCKGKKHRSPPDVIQLDREGNPRGRVNWNTVCPLAMMEFIENLQGTPKWKPYVKWNDSGSVSKQNHGDVPLLANQWLHHQVSLPLFDKNSGRKALARWLEELGIPYEQGFQIHGDLPSTWRTSYQPSIPRTTFPDRTQSRDPDEATQALRAFAKWLNEETETLTIREQLQQMLNNMD